MGAILSRDKIAKYFEVRLFSLVIMAAAIFILCIFLLFLFVWREQYIYAAMIVGVMVILILAATRLLQYARTLGQASPTSKQ